MNILMLAVNDPASTAIIFTNAINRYTEHRCRLITKELRYSCQYEQDLHLQWLTQEDWDEVEYLLRTADIFHFHMTADEDMELGPFRPREFLAGKMMVHHHHGHPDFRKAPEKYQRKYVERNRSKLLVSTPDLLEKLPGSVWQPNMVPLNNVLYLPMDRTHSEPPVRIAHSPTRRDLKNTDELLRALASLRSTGHDFQLELIENRSHMDCLRSKRRCHLAFDHLQGYFGMSSLEALSQGLCVVAGLDDWNQTHVRAFANRDRLPWVISSLDRLSADLSRLILDRDLREAYGRYARSFMEQCWSEQLVVEHLINFYMERQIL